jgi:hypothetical protein
VNEPWKPDHFVAYLQIPIDEMTGEYLRLVAQLANAKIAQISAQTKLEILSKGMK